MADRKQPDAHPELAQHAVGLIEEMMRILDVARTPDQWGDACATLEDALIHRFTEDVQPDENVVGGLARLVVTAVGYAQQGLVRLETHMLAHHADEPPVRHRPPNEEGLTFGEDLLR